MKAKYHVYLEDEAPRIGCGWRLVEAVVGYKWARLTETSTNHKQRLRRSTWDQLKKRELPNSGDDSMK